MTVLPEHHVVENEGSLQVALLLDFTPVWQQRNMSFDLGFAIGRDPKRIEIRIFDRSALARLIKHYLPRILATLARCVFAETSRDVHSSSVPLVPMHTSFAFFQINRVGRQVPVNDSVTVHSSPKLRQRMRRDLITPERRPFLQIRHSTIEGRQYDQLLGNSRHDVISQLFVR